MTASVAPLMTNELPRVNTDSEEFDLSNYGIPCMEERPLGTRFSETAKMADMFGLSKRNYELLEEEPEEEKPDPGRFNVILETEGSGTLSANPRQNVIPGTTVLLDATAAAGHSIKSWEVVSGGVELLDYSGLNADKLFIMPPSNVTIKVVFEEMQIGPEPDYSKRKVRFSKSFGGSFPGSGTFTFTLTKTSYPSAAPIVFTFVKSGSSYGDVNVDVPNGTYTITEVYNGSEPGTEISGILGSLQNNLANESIRNLSLNQLELTVKNNLQNVTGTESTLLVNFINNTSFVVPPQLGEWLDKAVVAIEDLEMSNSTINGNIVVGGRFGGRNLVTIQGPDNTFISNGEYFGSGAFASRPATWTSDHIDNMPQGVRFYNELGSSVFNSKMKLFRHNIQGHVGGLSGLPSPFPRNTAPTREWMETIYPIVVPTVDSISVAAGAPNISSSAINQIFEFKNDGKARYSTDNGATWILINNSTLFNFGNLSVSHNHCTIRFISPSMGANWKFNKIEISGVDSRIEFYGNTARYPIKLDCKNGFLQTGPVNDNNYGGFKNYGTGDDPGDGESNSIRIMTEGDFVTCNFSATVGIYNNVDFYLIALKGSMRIGHRTRITGNVFARNIHLGENSIIETA